MLTFRTPSQNAGQGWPVAAAGAGSDVRGHASWAEPNIRTWTWCVETTFWTNRQASDPSRKSRDSAPRRCQYASSGLNSATCPVNPARTGRARRLLIAPWLYVSVLLADQVCCRVLSLRPPARPREWSSRIIGWSRSADVARCPALHYGTTRPHLRHDTPRPPHRSMGGAIVPLTQ